MKSKTTVYKSFLNLPEVIDTLICVLQDGYPNEATKQRGIKCGYLDKQTRYKMFFTSLKYMYFRLYLFSFDFIM